MRATAAVLLVLAAAAARGATIQVSRDGGADFTDVQAAADAAADGDTVLVLPGEYVLAESLDFNRLYDPAAPASPPVKNIVVRSIGGAAFTVLRLAETLPVPARASVVVFENGESAASVLEGVTVTGGRGMSGGGGGITCAGAASPRIVDCVITGNAARGIACSKGGMPEFVRCVVTRNSGGGIGLQSGGARFTDCVITDNFGGGVIGAYAGDFAFTRCRIAGNQGSKGGGVACTSSASPVFTDCTIVRNTARDWDGGGVFLSSSARPIFRGCTIVGNASADGAGGIACIEQSALTATDCIVWGNAGGSLSVAATASANVSYSCIEGDAALPGAGNTNADPRLCGWGAAPDVYVDAAASGPGDGSQHAPYAELGSAFEFDLTPASDSPCIGAGTDGRTMGAHANAAGAAGVPQRTVHVAPGTYASPGVLLAPHASLLGAGAAATTIESTIFGLQTGSVLADVMVTKGTASGVSVAQNEAPEIRDCNVTGNQYGDDFGAGGVRFGPGSAGTVTNVRIAGNTTSRWGAALDCGIDSRPTFTACVIEGNTPSGLTCHERCAAKFLQCVIRGNGNGVDPSGNGAEVAGTATPTFDACVFADNRAAGLRFETNAVVAVTDCTFTGNGGAGLLLYGTSTGTVRGSTFMGNTGGIYSLMSRVVVEDCRIERNTAQEGGGVDCSSSPALQFRNCIIARNYAERGGAIRCLSASPAFTNCSIVDNMAELEAGAVACEENARPKLASCIVWNNGEAPIAASGTSSCIAEYSCIQTPQVWPGTGNINLDPRFCGWGAAMDVYVDPSAAGPGDGTAASPYRNPAAALTFSYGLSAASPCLTAGRNGVRMGAETGSCDAEGAPSRLVHVAAGRIQSALMPAMRSVSIQGAGAGATVLEGTLRGLTTGAVLADVSVVDGTQGGIVVPAGQAPEIRNCSVRGAAGKGAITAGARAHPVLRDCVVEENAAGGLYVVADGAATLTGCVVRRNYGVSVGEGAGGVTCRERSSVTMTDCRVEANTSQSAGGVWAASAASLVLERCRIAGNRSTSSGGGIGLSNVAGALLVNCSISGNGCANGPSGIACFGGSGIRLLCCTVADNEGTALYARIPMSLEVVDSIVWNRLYGGPVIQDGAVLLASYSCISGDTVWPGEGMINADPRFVLPGVYDFTRWATIEVQGVRYYVPDSIIRAPNLEPRLGSPVVDTGTADGAPAVDILGRARPYGTGIDMGAYESHGDPGAQGRTIRVPQDAATIQDALDAALDGDTVLVAAGEYVFDEPLDFNRLADPDDVPRQARKNVTLKAAEGPAQTILRPAPRAVDQRRGVVTFRHEEDARSVIDGFAITGGKQAGISCVSRSSPRITSCRLTGNGSGIVAEQSSPHIVACASVGNAGHGVYYDRCWNSRIEACELRGNGATGFTVSSTSSSTVTLDGCTIVDNDRGGINCESEASLRISNCLIAGNLADRGGGIAVGWNCTPEVVRCTIVHNSARWEGGGVLADAGANVQLRECIVWGNAGGSIALDTRNEDWPGLATVDHSCIEGETVWPGAGNFAADPRFGAWGAPAEVYVDPAHPAPGAGTAEHPYATLPEALVYDYALAIGSPCLSAAAGGGAIGADKGTCATAGTKARLVGLAAGTYPSGRANLAHGVSLRGAGRAQTVLEGALVGLRTAAFLEDLTVTKGTVGGLVIPAGEGPRVTRCALTGNAALGYGGGAYAGSDATPTLQFCRLEDNTAAEGGGLYASVDAMVTLQECTIAGNSSTLGGGLRLHYAKAVLSDCRIERNSATTGGGVYSSSAELAVDASRIADNVADIGAGLYLEVSGEVRLTTCDLARNRAKTEGAGVFVLGSGSPLKLEGCTVTGNIAGTRGGGFLARANHLMLDDCVVTGNSAGKAGGAVHLSSNARLTAGHVTFAGNASAMGGAVMSDGTAVTLRDSIVWGNGSDALHGYVGATWNATYSCLESEPLLPGQGNIRADPRFCAWASATDVYVDAAQADPGDGTVEHPYNQIGAAFVYNYALSEGSPCIRTGEGGTNMGAELGTCAAGGAEERTVHISAGTYDLTGLVLPMRTNLRGAGIDRTFLRGPVRGLASGAVVADVTVVGDGAAGIEITPGLAPRIEGCVIACTGDCGIVANGAAPSIADCVVEGARTGIACVGGTPSVVRCTIRGNKEQGLRLDAAAGTVSACTISGNGTYGVTLTNRSTTAIAGCTIQGNGAGGVSCASNAAPTFTDCTVSANGASAQNGGGFAVADAAPTLENCTITGNFALKTGGGAYFSNAAATIKRCTLAFNAAGGIGCAGAPVPAITGSIVWGNAGGSVGGAVAPAFAFSCVAGDAPPPGPGNIAADPRFCDDGLPEEVYVDAANPGRGTGTREDPYRDMADALACSCALAADSPCRGSGENGADMGADRGVCASAATVGRRLIVRPGTYAIEGLSCALATRIEGAGAGTTVLQGTLRGLRTGATVANLSVTGTVADGAYIVPGENPAFEGTSFAGSLGNGIVSAGGGEFSACAFTDNANSGIRCETGAAPVLRSCMLARNGKYGVDGREAQLVLEACEARENKSSGLYLWKADAELTACVVAENQGNGLDATGTLRCVDSTFEGNGKVGISLGRDAAFNVEGCSVRANRSGGILCLDRGTGTIARCAITRNTGCDGSGGIGFVSCAPLLTSCVVSDNRSEYKGGALSVHYGAPVVVDCTFADNLAYQGGAVYCSGGTPTFTRCTFSGNGAGGEGSVFYVTRSAAVSVGSSILWENGHPAMRLDGGQIDIRYSCVQAVTGYASPWPGEGNVQADPRFSGWEARDVVYVDAANANAADGSAAAPYPDLVPALAYGLALARTSPCIGTGENGTTMGADHGVCDDPGVPVRTINVAPGTYSGGWYGVGHRARLAGAGPQATRIEATLFGFPGRSTLSGVTVARGTMGALLLAGEGSPVVHHVVFRENLGRASCGIVTCTDCAPSFDNCVFTSNSSVSDGMVYARTASVALTNCVFAANEGPCVDSSKACTGTTCVSTGTFVLVNCTLLDNRGSPAEVGDADFTNCIIRDCSPYGTPVLPPAAKLHACVTDVDPLVESRGGIDFGRRVSSGLSGCYASVPDFVTAPADYRLRADSPALDAGIAAGAPIIDLDDHARPCGAGVDIGAYERGDCPSRARDFRRGDTNDDGRLNIADAIATLGFLFARGAPPRCFDAADANDDGRLNIGDALTTLMHLFAGLRELEPPFGACGPDATPDALPCEGAALCGGR